MGSILWSGDRPDFVERVAKLAGGTTYRTPTAGRGTNLDQLPDTHAIAAALSFARRGPDDIGPDVAYSWVLQSDAYREPVTRKLAVALNSGEVREEARRGGVSQTGAFRRAAAYAGWDAMIHDRRTAQPVGVPNRLWDMLLLGAIGTLHASAWDSLAEAERAYHRAA